jgi:hypothetical protein
MPGTKLKMERSSCTAQTRKQCTPGVFSPTGGPSRQRIGEFMTGRGARQLFHFIETEWRSQIEEK